MKLYHPATLFMPFWLFLAIAAAIFATIENW